MFDTFFGAICFRSIQTTPKEAEDDSKGVEQTPKRVVVRGTGLGSLASHIIYIYILYLHEFSRRSFFRRLFEYKYYYYTAEQSREAERLDENVRRLHRHAARKEGKKATRSHRRPRRGSPCRGTPRGRAPCILVLCIARPGGSFSKHFGVFSTHLGSCSA